MSDPSPPARAPVPALVLVRRPSAAVRGGVLLAAVALALGLAVPRGSVTDETAARDQAMPPRAVDLPCTRRADIASGNHCLKDGRSVRVVLR